MTTGFVENLPKSRMMTLLRTDVRHVTRLNEIISRERPGVIFHLAAPIPNKVGHAIRYSSSSPQIMTDVVVKGALNVLEAAKKTHSRVMVVSSAAIYGSSPKSTVCETDFAQPNSVYGVSKYCSEMYCQLYRSFGLDIRVARLFNAYGPRQRKYLFFDLLWKLRNNQHKLRLIGDGNQVRDYIHVADVVEAFVKIGMTDSDEWLFNVGSGTARSVMDVVKKICNTLEIKPKILHTPVPWVGDVGGYSGDVSRLKQKLSWTPTRLWDHGLTEMIEWFVATFGLPSHSSIRS